MSVSPLSVMASPRMTTLTQTFFVRESLRYFPILLDPSTKTFSKSSKQNHKIFICLYILSRLYFIPILHSLRSKLTERRSQSPNLELESEIFAHLVLLVFGILCLVNHYTMNCRMEAWLFTCNQVHQLQSRKSGALFLSEYIPKNPNNSSSSSHLLEFLMGQVNSSIIGILGAQVISVILNKDPLSIYLPVGLFNASIINWLILFLLRLFWLLVFVYMDWQSNCAVIFPTVIGLRIINASLANNLRLCKSIILYENPAKASLRLKEVIKHHRTLLVVEKAINEAYFLLHPFLLLFGMTIIVVCNCGTVRLYGRISILVYFVLPFLSLISVAMILTIFPAVSSAHESSCNIIQDAKHSIRTKYLGRLIRSEMNFRFYAGSFFYVKKETKLTYIAFLLDKTITALISSRLY